MITDLVLFCGGDPIYAGNKPKPLALMPNSLSVLENYLRQKPLQQVPKITILAEADFLSDFERVAQGSHTQLKNINLLSVPNKSSTLDKLKKVCSSDCFYGSSLLFTYPDIFYFGSWEKLFSSEATSSKMRISCVYLQSRFSEISYNPYTRKALSLSLKPSRIPANKSIIYAGHLFAKTADLLNALDLFERNNGKIPKPTLEGDFFKCLVSEGLIEVDLLEDLWIKADSNKEMIEIINRLDC